MIAEERIEVMARALNAVSHSVAGPLQTVMNRLFVLRKRASTESGVTVEALTELETEFRSIAGRLESLTALPLVFAPASMRHVALREIVHGAVAFAGLTGRVDVWISAPDMMVRVDGRHLTHALAALLTNAAEASRDDEPISLTVSSDGNSLMFRVKDNGTSARSWPNPPEQAFDPLFTSKAQSVGLGLPLVHRVATAAGGYVRIEPDKPGSVVSMILPLEAKSDVA